jgi:uncharacterized protein (DUF2236 family)
VSVALHAIDRVERDAFEARLHSAAGAAREPMQGLFGPDSMVWRVHRESIVFLGAGAALLLQNAHPWIAQAVADHSKALKDPLGRYYRTFRPVFAMVFGTLGQALAHARAVRAIHDRIEGVLPEQVGAWAAGTRYFANEAHALLWVHATLWHTGLSVHERIFGPLTALERDRYYDETRHFAALFGVPEELLPHDWNAFEDYVAAMANSGILAVGTAGRLIASFFIEPGGLRLGTLVPAWYRAVTALLLPAPIAAAFDLPRDASTLARAERALARTRRYYARLPESVRFVGPYQEAMARIAGRAEPGLWVKTANRLWLGRSCLEPRGV